MNITKESYVAMQEKINNLAKKNKNHISVGGFTEKNIPEITIKQNINKNLYIEFIIDPMGKPRMTQSDKWKKREVTGRYWSYKHKLKTQANAENFVLPESGLHMIFYMPMPKSWSKAKKENMSLRPHKCKPDADNILKGVQDCLCKDDSYIWDVRITKYWAYKGKIIINKIK